MTELFETFGNTKEVLVIIGKQAIQCPQEKRQEDIQWSSKVLLNNYDGCN